MDSLTWSLVPAAAAIGLTHTLIGPDHYVPFIMLARARGWSTRKTLAVTLACGGAHVAASLLLAGIGVGLGMAVGALEGLESARGSLAAWGLFGFGLAYAAGGIRRGIRRAGGLTPHAHGSTVHLHPRGDRLHHHHGTGVPGSGEGGSGSAASFWALFALFVLGPCEPLIPLFVLPASQGRWLPAAGAAAVFGVVTVAAMTGATWLGLRGLAPLRLARLARWEHALAGGVIALSGVALLTLGL